MNRKYCFFFSTAMLFTLFFSGCAPRQEMLKEDALMAAGEYREAAEYARSNIDGEDRYDIDNLLWYLQSGSALLFVQENSESIQAFDESEALMKHYREQILASDISQTLRSTLLNDTTRPYIGAEYDGIMVNTYKAIDYMSLGDMDAARVEFNRAIDRQRRAKEFFAQMIEKERQAIQEKEEEERSGGEELHISKTMNNPAIKTRLQQSYPSLYAFEPYPDFINPMTTYLAGIFAMADDNYGKAETLLKEAYGMMSDNADVEADFQSILSLLDSGQKEMEPMVWVIFENGQAPLLEEWRIDLPVFIVSSHLNYISVALPRLTEREKAFDALDIVINGDEHITTGHLCSMDRVIKTEFKKQYESILRRAIFSMVTKTTIQYTLQEQGHNNNTAALLGLLATIYQVATTQADTRIWSTLPKEFQLTRFARPNDGKVRITTPQGKVLSQIELPKREHLLVYVKIATPSAVPSVSVIPFGRR